jgi:anaerobic dimethyl sulfoxide reductase subunit C
MNVREWALPVYTVLIQMATGMLLFLWILRAYGRYKPGEEVINRVVRDPLLIIVTTIIFGMAGGHFHLSKPYLSFLAVLNFRTSWLSREIVFTLLFFITTAFLWYVQWRKKGNWRLHSILGWLAIAFGIVTVYCMGKIYLLPTQEAWNTPETIISFYGSMLLLGVMALAEILIMDLRFKQVGQNEDLTEWAILIKEAVKRLAVAAGVILILVICINIYHLNLLRTGTGLARTSYDLLMELYQPLLIVRFLLLTAGVSVLIYSVARMKRTGELIQELFPPAYMACLLVIIGEVLERFLFYAAHIRMGI